MTARRNDLIVALFMLVGGALPAVALYLLFDGAIWAAVVGGAIFWPCAFFAGCFAVRNEDRRGW